MEIRLENVSKSFGKIKVLTDVNIKFMAYMEEMVVGKVFY